jgi:Zn-finger protein
MSDELTDRVAFCVAKANCNGPSFCETKDGRDVWTCRHCGGFVTLDKDEQPVKVRRLPYGTRGLA